MKLSSLGVWRYALYSEFRMMENFACKETEKIFILQFSKRLPTDFQQIAYRKLKMYNKSCGYGKCLLCHTYLCV